MKQIKSFVQVRFNFKSRPCCDGFQPSQSRRHLKKKLYSTGAQFQNHCVCISIIDYRNNLNIFWKQIPPGQTAVLCSILTSDIIYRSGYRSPVFSAAAAPAIFTNHYADQSPTAGFSMPADLMEQKLGHTNSIQIPLNY